MPIFHGDAVPGSDPILIAPEVISGSGVDEYDDMMHVDPTPQPIEFFPPKSDLLACPQRAPLHHLRASEFSAILSSESLSRDPFDHASLFKDVPGCSSELRIEAGSQAKLDVLTPPISPNPFTTALGPIGNWDKAISGEDTSPQPVHGRVGAEGGCRSCIDEDQVPKVPGPAAEVTTTTTAMGPDTLPTQSPTPEAIPIATATSHALARRVTNCWPEGDGDDPPSGTAKTDPNMRELKIGGLTAPNGIPLWGASLNDFDRVRCTGVMEDSVVSGSVLAAYFATTHGGEVAKALGGGRGAGDVGREYERPRRLEADFWVAEGVRRVEERIRKGEVGVSMTSEDSDAGGGEVGRLFLFQSVV